MPSTLIKYCITVAAIVLIGIRLLRPELKFDSTLVVLVVIAAVPWVASVFALKAVELPGGFKFEFREENKPEPRESAKIDKTSPEPSSLTTRRALSDNYFARLIKLTPIETIVTYLVVDRMIPVPERYVLAPWTALFFLLLTPLYLWRLGADLRHIIISTFGFAAWALAIGSAAYQFDWFPESMGALALLLFTYGAPLFATKGDVTSDSLAAPPSSSR